MNLLVAPFADNEFMRLALTASVLVALTCAVAGTWVVLRGLAFVGDALAHGVLPGIATALLLGVSGLLGAAVGAIIMMAGVGVVTRRLRLGGDTAIGLLFVAMLALGVAITSRSESFTGDLTRILFGELLGATPGTLGIQTVALAAVVVIAVVAHRPLLMMSVDEGLAQAAGFSARFFHAMMLAMVAISVITGFQTVGTLLVLGMLIAPPATGALFARRIGSMTAIAAASGVASSYAGLLVSFHFDLAAGASIVLVATGIFAVAAVAKMIVHAGRPDDDVPHAHGTVHVP